MSVEHGGDVWRGGAPGDWLDFSANLNPEGPPEWVRQALAEGLGRVRYYPDIRAGAATAGLSAHLGLPTECVLPTAGGIEAAALAARLPLAAGGGVARQLIAQPTFGEYGRLCGPHDSVARSALEALTLCRGDRLWLCNPNNPTGDALSLGALRALLARAEAAGAELVVDEAFIDYCPEVSVRGLVRDHPALMVLGSLTKVLAIPGARLGYLAAHPRVIEGLRTDAATISGRVSAPPPWQALPPWRLNCLADAVAAALPGHGADFRAIREKNAVRRADLARRLEALGAKVHPSQASFVLADLGRDAGPLAEALTRERILVRRCGDFEGLTAAHVRLCVRTEADHAALIGALSRAMEAQRRRG